LPFTRKIPLNPRIIKQLFLPLVRTYAGESKTDKKTIYLYEISPNVFFSKFKREPGAKQCTTQKYPQAHRILRKSLVMNIKRNYILLAMIFIPWQIVVGDAWGWARDSLGSDKRSTDSTTVDAGRNDDAIRAYGACGDKNASGWQALLEQSAGVVENPQHEKRVYNLDAQQEQLTSILGKVINGYNFKQRENGIRSKEADLEQALRDLTNPRIQANFQGPAWYGNIEAVWSASLGGFFKPVQMEQQRMAEFAQLKAIQGQKALDVLGAYLNLWRATAEVQNSQNRMDCARGILRNAHENSDKLGDAETSLAQAALLESEAETDCLAAEQALMDHGLRQEDMDALDFSDFNLDTIQAVLANACRTFSIVKDMAGNLLATYQAQLAVLTARGEAIQNDRLQGYLGGRLIYPDTVVGNTGLEIFGRVSYNLWDNGLTCLQADRNVKQIELTLTWQNQAQRDLGFAHRDARENLEDLKSVAGLACQRLSLSADALDQARSDYQHRATTSIPLTNAMRDYAANSLLMIQAIGGWQQAETAAAAVPAAEPGFAESFKCLNDLCDIAVKNSLVLKISEVESDEEGIKAGSHGTAVQVGPYLQVDRSLWSTVCPGQDIFRTYNPIQTEGGLEGRLQVVGPNGIFNGGVDRLLSKADREEQETKKIRGRIEAINLRQDVLKTYLDEESARSEFNQAQESLTLLRSISEDEKATRTVRQNKAAESEWVMAEIKVAQAKVKWRTRNLNLVKILGWPAGTRIEVPVLDLTADNLNGWVRSLAPGTLVTGNAGKNLPDGDETYLALNRRLFESQVAASSDQAEAWRKQPAVSVEGWGRTGVNGSALSGGQKVNHAVGFYISIPMGRTEENQEHASLAQSNADLQQKKAVDFFDQAVARREGLAQQLHVTDLHLQTLDDQLYKAMGDFNEAFENQKRERIEKSQLWDLLCEVNALKQQRKSLLAERAGLAVMVKKLNARVPDYQPAHPGLDQPAPPADVLRRFNLEAGIPEKPSDEKPAGPSQPKPVKQLSVKALTNQVMATPDVLRLQLDVQAAKNNLEDRKRKMVLTDIGVGSIKDIQGIDQQPIAAQVNFKALWGQERSIRSLESGVRQAEAAVQNAIFNKMVSAFSIMVDIQRLRGMEQKLQSIINASNQQIKEHPEKTRTVTLSLKSPQDQMHILKDEIQSQEIELRGVLAWKATEPLPAMEQQFPGLNKMKNQSEIIAWLQQNLTDDPRVRGALQSLAATQWTRDQKALEKWCPELYSTFMAFAPKQAGSYLQGRIQAVLYDKGEGIHQAILSNLSAQNAQLMVDQEKESIARELSGLEKDLFAGLQEYQAARDYVNQAEKNLADAQDTFQADRTLGLQEMEDFKTVLKVQMDLADANQRLANAQGKYFQALARLQAVIDAVDSTGKGVHFEEQFKFVTTAGQMNDPSLVAQTVQAEGRGPAQTTSVPPTPDPPPAFVKITGSREQPVTRKKNQAPVSQAGEFSTAKKQALATEKARDPGQKIAEETSWKTAVPQVAPAMPRQVAQLEQALETTFTRADNPGVVFESADARNVKTSDNAEYCFDLLQHYAAEKDSLKRAELKRKLAGNTAFLLGMLNPNHLFRLGQAWTTSSTPTRIDSGNVAVDITDREKTSLLRGGERSCHGVDLLPLMLTINGKQVDLVRAEDYSTSTWQTAEGMEARGVYKIKGLTVTQIALIPNGQETARIQCQIVSNSRQPLNIGPYFYRVNFHDAEAVRLAQAKNAVWLPGSTTVYTTETMDVNPNGDKDITDLVHKAGQNTIVTYFWNKAMPVYMAQAPSRVTLHASGDIKQDWASLEIGFKGGRWSTDKAGRRFFTTIPIYIDAMWKPLTASRNSPVPDDLAADIPIWQAMIKNNQGDGRSFTTEYANAGAGLALAKLARFWAQQGDQAKAQACREAAVQTGDYQYRVYQDLLAGKDRDDKMLCYGLGRYYGYLEPFFSALFQLTGDTAWRDKILVVEDECLQLQCTDPRSQNIEYKKIKIHGQKKEVIDSVIDTGGNLLRFYYDSDTGAIRYFAKLLLNSGETAGKDALPSGVKVEIHGADDRELRKFGILFRKGRVDTSLQEDALIPAYGLFKQKEGKGSDSAYSLDSQGAFLIGLAEARQLCLDLAAKAHNREQKQCYINRVGTYTQAAQLLIHDGLKVDEDGRFYGYQKFDPQTGDLTEISKTGTSEGQAMVLRGLAEWADYDVKADELYKLGTAYFNRKKWVSDKGVAKTEKSMPDAESTLLLALAWRSSPVWSWTDVFPFGRNLQCVWDRSVFRWTAAMGEIMVRQCNNQYRFDWKPVRGARYYQINKYRRDPETGLWKINEGRPGKTNSSWRTTPDWVVNLPKAGEYKYEIIPFALAGNRGYHQKNQKYIDGVAGESQTVFITQREVSEDIPDLKKPSESTTDARGRVHITGMVHRGIPEQPIILTPGRGNDFQYDDLFATIRFSQLAIYPRAVGYEWEVYQGPIIEGKEPFLRFFGTKQEFKIKSQKKLIPGYDYRIRVRSWTGQRGERGADSYWDYIFRATRKIQWQQGTLKVAENVLPATPNQVRLLESTSMVVWQGNARYYQVETWQVKAGNQGKPGTARPDYLKHQRAVYWTDQPSVVLTEPATRIVITGWSNLPDYGGQAGSSSGVRVIAPQHMIRHPTTLISKEEVEFTEASGNYMIKLKKAYFSKVIQVTIVDPLTEKVLSVQRMRDEKGQAPYLYLAGQKIKSTLERNAGHLDVVFHVGERSDITRTVVWNEDGLRMQLQNLSPWKIADAPGEKVNPQTITLQGNLLSFARVPGVTTYKVTVKNADGELIQEESVEAADFNTVALHVKDIRGYRGTLKVEIYSGKHQTDRYNVYAEEEKTEKFFTVNANELPCPEEGNPLRRALDPQKILLGPITRPGFATDSTPCRIHFIDFLRSPKNMNKPALCRVDFYSTGGTRLLGSKVIETRDSRNGYAFLDVEGAFAQEAIKQGDLVIKVYAGIRNDARGDVFESEGITKVLPIATAEVIGKNDVAKFLAAIKQPGAIVINRSQMTIQVPQLFEKFTNHFRIELWSLNDRNEYVKRLDTQISHGGDASRIYLTGAAVRNAAAGNRLGIRIYPGKYRATPYPADYISEREYYSFKPANQKKMAQFIPKLSAGEADRMLAGIQTAHVTYAVKNYSYGDVVDVVIPHTLTGRHNLRVSAFDPRGLLISSQMVEFEQGKPITFRLSPADTAPLLSPDAPATLVLEPGLSLEDANQTMGLDAQFITPKNASQHRLFSGRAVKLKALLSGKGAAAVRLTQASFAPSPRHAVAENLLQWEAITTSKLKTLGIDEEDFQGFRLYVKHVATNRAEVYKTRNSFFSLAGFKPGVYQWRVEYLVDAEPQGEHSLWSIPVRFIVQPKRETRETSPILSFNIQRGNPPQITTISRNDQWAIPGPDRTEPFGIFDSGSRVKGAILSKAGKVYEGNPRRQLIRASKENGPTNVQTIQTMWWSDDGTLKMYKQNIMVPGRSAALNTFQIEPIRRPASNDSQYVISMSFQPAVSVGRVSVKRLNLEGTDYIVALFGDGQFQAVKSSDLSGWYVGDQVKQALLDMTLMNNASGFESSGEGLAFYLRADPERLVKIFSGNADAQTVGETIAASEKFYRDGVEALQSFYKHGPRSREFLDHMVGKVFCQYFWDEKDGTFSEVPYDQYANNPGTLWPYNRWTSNSAEVEYVLLQYRAMVGNRKIGDHDLDYYIRRNGRFLESMQSPSGSFYLRVSKAMRTYFSAESKSIFLDNSSTVIEISKQDRVLIRQGYEPLASATLGDTVVNEDGIDRKINDKDKTHFTYTQPEGPNNPLGKKMSSTRTFTMKDNSLALDERLTLWNGLRGVEVNHTIRNTSLIPKTLNSHHSGLHYLAADEETQTNPEGYAGLPNCKTQLYIPGIDHPLLAEDFVRQWAATNRKYIPFGKIPEEDKTSPEAKVWVNQKMNEMIRQTGTHYVVAYGWDKLVVMYLPNGFSRNTQLELDFGRSPYRAKKYLEWTSVQRRIDFKGRRLQPGESVRVDPMWIDHHWANLSLLDRNGLPSERYLADLWIKELSAHLANPQAPRKAVVLDTNYAYPLSGIVLFGLSDFYAQRARENTGELGDEYLARAREYGDRGVKAAVFAKRTFDTSFGNDRVNPPYGIMRFYGYHIELYEKAFAYMKNQLGQDAYARLLKNPDTPETQKEWIRDLMEMGHFQSRVWTGPHQSATVTDLYQQAINKLINDTHSRGLEKREDVYKNLLTKTYEDTWQGEVFKIADAITAHQDLDESSAAYGGFNQNEGPSFRQLDDNGFKLYALRLAYDRAKKEWTFNPLKMWRNVDRMENYQAAAKLCIEKWYRVTDEGDYVGYRDPERMANFDEQRTTYGQVFSLLGIGSWIDRIPAARRKFLGGLKHFRRRESTGNAALNFYGPTIYTFPDQPGDANDNNTENGPGMLRAMIHTVQTMNEGRDADLRILSQEAKPVPKTQWWHFSLPNSLWLQAAVAFLFIFFWFQKKRVWDPWLQQRRAEKVRRALENLPFVSAASAEWGTAPAGGGSMVAAANLERSWVFPVFGHIQRSMNDIDRIYGEKLTGKTLNARQKLTRWLLRHISFPPANVRPFPFFPPPITVTRGKLCPGKFYIPLPFGYGMNIFPSQPSYIPSGWHRRVAVFYIRKQMNSLIIAMGKELNLTGIDAKIAVMREVINVFQENIYNLRVTRNETRDAAAAGNTGKEVEKVIRQADKLEALIGEARRRKTALQQAIQDRVLRDVLAHLEFLKTGAVGKNWRSQVAEQARKNSDEVDQYLVRFDANLAMEKAKRQSPTHLEKLAKLADQGLDYAPAMLQMRLALANKLEQRLQMLCQAMDHPTQALLRELFGDSLIRKLARAENDAARNEIVDDTLNRQALEWERELVELLEKVDDLIKTAMDYLDKSGKMQKAKDLFETLCVLLLGILGVYDRKIAAARIHVGNVRELGFLQATRELYRAQWKAAEAAIKKRTRQAEGSWVPIRPLQPIGLKRQKEVFIKWENIALKIRKINNDFTENEENLKKERALWIRDHGYLSRLLGRQFLLGDVDSRAFKAAFGSLGHFNQDAFLVYFNKQFKILEKVGGKVYFNRKTREADGTDTGEGISVLKGLGAKDALTEQPLDGLKDSEVYRTILRRLNNLTDRQVLDVIRNILVDPGFPSKVQCDPNLLPADIAALHVRVMGTNQALLKYSEMVKLNYALFAQLFPGVIAPSYHDQERGIKENIDYLQTTLNEEYGSQLLRRSVSRTWKSSAYFIGVFLALVTFNVSTFICYDIAWYFVLLLLPILFKVAWPIAHKTVVYFAGRFNHQGPSMLTLEEVKGYIKKYARERDHPFVLPIVKPKISSSLDHWDNVLIYVDREIKNAVDTMRYLGPDFRINFVFPGATTEPGIRAYERKEISKFTRTVKAKYGQDIADQVSFTYMTMNRYWDFKRPGQTGRLFHALIGGHTTSDYYLNTQEFDNLAIVPGEPMFKDIEGDLIGLFGCGRDGVVVTEPGEHINDNARLIEAFANGERLVIKQNDIPEIAWHMDDKNTILPGGLMNGLRFMLHPDNCDITLGLPGILVEKPVDDNGIEVTSPWIEMMMDDRLFSNFAESNVMAAITDGSFAHFGKNVSRIKNWTRIVVEGEALAPKYSLSHDWNESLLSVARLMYASSRHSIEGIKKIGGNMTGGGRQLTKTVDEYYCKIRIGHDLKTCVLRAEGMDLQLLCQSLGSFRNSIKLEGLMASGIILNALSKSLTGRYWSYQNVVEVPAAAAGERRYKIAVRINRHRDTQECSEILTCFYSEKGNEIIIDQESGGHLKIERECFFLQTLNNTAVKKLIMGYLWEQVDVMERDMVSPFGVSLRDTRWLPGDLHMIKFALPYKKYMSPRDQFHLSGLGRRFTLDLLSALWIVFFTLLSLNGSITLENLGLSMKLLGITLGIIIVIDKLINPIDYYRNLWKSLKVLENDRLRKLWDSIQFYWDLFNKAFAYTLYGTLTAMTKLVSRPQEYRTVFGLDKRAAKLEWLDLDNTSISLMERQGFPLFFKRIRDGKIIPSYYSNDKRTVWIGLFLWILLYGLGSLGIIWTHALWVTIGTFLTSFTIGFMVKWLAGLPGKKIFGFYPLVIPAIVVFWSWATPILELSSLSKWGCVFYTTMGVFLITELLTALPVLKRVREERAGSFTLSASPCGQGYNELHPGELMALRPGREPHWSRNPGFNNVHGLIKMMRRGFGPKVPGV